MPVIIEEVIFEACGFCSEKMWLVKFVLTFMAGRWRGSVDTSIATT